MLEWIGVVCVTYTLCIHITTNLFASPFTLTSFYNETSTSVLVFVRIKFVSVHWLAT